MNDFDKIGVKAEITNTVTNCIFMFVVGMIVCSLF